MLTLNDARVVLATYEQTAQRSARERVLAHLEALLDGEVDTATVTSAHLDELARRAVHPEEHAVVAELRERSTDAPRAPARFAFSETPVFERTRRISDLIASTLEESAPHSR